MSLKIPFPYLSGGYADASKTGENFSFILDNLNSPSPINGLVNFGSQYQLPYYAGNGNALSPLALITSNRALISNANGLPIASSVTNVELGYLSGVTSSVQTQLNNAKEFINVKSFGAVGDGITDDTTSIQNAINSIVSTGGTIYFPIGTYIISALRLRNHMSLLGTGFGTLIKLKNSANNTMITNADEDNPITEIYIANLRMDGNASNQSALRHAISFRGGRNCIIENVWIENVTGDGIIFGETTGLLTSSDFKILHCFVKDFGRNGISVTMANNFVIDGCTLYDSKVGADPGDGIDIEPNSTSTPITGGIISNCHAYSNAGHGFDIHDITGTTHVVDHIVFNACHARDNAKQGIDFYYTKWCSIIGGTYISNDGDGIRLEGACLYTKIDNVSSVGNTGYGFKEVVDGSNSPDFSAYINTTSLNNGTDSILILGSNSSQAFTNSLSKITGNLTISGLTANRALTTGAADLLVSSATTDTELGYVSGVTSSIQTQLNGKANTSLNNLASVAINTSLLPASNNAIDLGSATPLNFRTGYFGTSIVNNGYLDMLGIVNPASPAAGTARFHAATINGFTRFEQDNEATTNLILGRDSVIIAKNTTASNMTKGQAVYITGSTGNVPNIGLAKADSLTTLPAVGVLLDNINQNNFGQVMVLGLLTSFDTHLFSVGDKLYVSSTTAGALTNVDPTYPNFSQHIGVVTVSGVGNGAIFLNVPSAIEGEDSGTSVDFTFGGTITTPLTANRALVSGTSSVVGISTTTDTELSYVHGVTSAIQTQINTKAADSAVVHNTGNETGLAGNKTWTGTILQTGQPCFQVTTVTGATNVTGDATDYTVVWDTEVFDVGSNFASNTFTAPVTGKYLLSTWVLMIDLTTSHTLMRTGIITSNRSYYFQDQVLVTGHKTQSLSVIADMDAGDTAYVTVKVSGSTKTVDFDGDAGFSVFSGSLIN